MKKDIQYTIKESITKIIRFIKFDMLMISNNTFRTTNVIIKDEYTGSNTHLRYAIIDSE